MLRRIKNLWELSRFIPEESTGTLIPGETYKKPKKKLATIIEMEKPLDFFPNAEDDDNPSK
jgi:hypothetical protein